MKLDLLLPYVEVSIVSFSIFTDIVGSSMVILRNRAEGKSTKLYFKYLFGFPKLLPIATFVFCKSNVDCKERNVGAFSMSTFHYILYIVEKLQYLGSKTRHCAKILPLGPLNWQCLSNVKGNV